MLEVERGEDLCSKNNLQQCPEGGSSWRWCPGSLPFPLPLFLQALGCLGVRDKFVMDALWQMVSLGLHGVQERRTQGPRSVEPWHLSTDKAHQGRE